MPNTATSNSHGRRIENANSSPKIWTNAMLSDLLQRMRADQSRELLAQLYEETPYRILKLRDQAERLERRGKTTGPFAALGSYTRNSLMGAGYSTIHQVRAALQDGSLGKATLLGPKRIEEIQDWLETMVEAEAA